MATYPVYDCTRADYIRDCQPIGEASSETEARTVLVRFLSGTGALEGLRIEAGTGEDHDAGVIITDDQHHPTVAWDSGVRTTVDIDSAADGVALAVELAERDTGAGSLWAYWLA